MLVFGGESDCRGFVLPRIRDKGFIASACYYSSHQPDRASLLSSVIHSKVEIDLRTLTQVDVNLLSARMDGFVASDLVTVTERAVHAGSSREISLGLHASRIHGKCIKAYLY